MKNNNTNNPKIAKPFVKWVGGKTQLITEIEKRLPESLNGNNDLIYVEPFVGGGATLFWILQRFPNIKKAIINDINPDLIGTYKVIKESPLDLIPLLRELEDEYISYSESKRKNMFLEKRMIYNNNDLTVLEKSALFIFLNRTCFNGMYRVNSKGKFNVPHGRYSNPKICNEDTIMADHLILQKVEILCGDFSKTIKYASPNTFFYFDPPYKPINETSSFNSYAKESFDDEDQIRLRDFCNKIVQNSSLFLLSNSDLKNHDSKNNFFDEMYKSFNINRVYASRMINANATGRGKLSELMIYNTL